MSENKTYDTIELEIEPAEKVESYIHYDRCVIVLNGKDILDIMREVELPFFKKEHLSESDAGSYHHMIPEELYEDLINAEASNREKIAHVLCCTCDVTDCASTRVRVRKTKNSIIWDNFESLRDWDFGLSFEFEINQYRAFLENVRKMTLK